MKRSVCQISSVQAALLTDLLLSGGTGVTLAAEKCLLAELYQYQESLAAVVFLPPQLKQQKPLDTDISTGRESLP